MPRLNLFIMNHTARVKEELNDADKTTIGWNARFIKVNVNDNFPTGTEMSRLENHESGRDYIAQVHN